MERIRPRKNSDGTGIFSGRNGIFSIFKVRNSVRLANKTLPKTIKNGERWSNFPNSPERPNKNTAKCISSNLN